MPVFNFLCNSCSFEKSELVFNIDEEVKCEKCNSIMQKLFSPPNNFKLTGDGWTEKSNRNSTGNIKDHTQQIKEDFKDIKSNDLYKNIDVPKDIK